MCVCMSSQARRALKVVWQWVGWEQPGVFCCRKRDRKEVLERGGGKHAWKYHHIVMHHWFPIHHKPEQHIPSSPNPPIQGLTLRQCVCDFTWVFLVAVQGALEQAWRVNEAQHHLLYKESGQTRGETAPVGLQTPVRGWEGAGDRGRVLSLLGVGWQGALLWLLVGDWSPEGCCFSFF